MRHDCLPTFIALLVAAILIVAPATASQSNLISNGDFDLSTAGWDAEAPWATWAAADVDGSPSSGSLKLVLGPDGPIGSTGGTLEVTASTCIELEPGDHFAVTGSVWVDQLGTGDQVGLGFALYRDVGCDVFAAGWSPYLWWADSTATGWQTGGRTVDGDVWAPRGLKVLLILEDNAPGTQISAYFDGLELRRGACEPGPAAGPDSSGPRYLCLNDDRFRVSASWQAPNGEGGLGVAVPYSANSGSFWFFDSSNLELNVKVLDGCSLNDRYWVFAAGLTDVEVVLTVYDTEADEYQNYYDPPSQTFVTVTDTDAFDTCP